MAEANNQTAWLAYQRKQDRVVNQARTMLARGEKLALAKPTSNLFRHRQKVRSGIDVSMLNQVITVDTANHIAHVEGMTTYETLVKATLAAGFLPTVVPELKSITIGGAVTGVGVESSSFRYGLVHETIAELDILLGDGRVITVSPTNEHRELFYSFPNTYGSLGYALRVVVRLYPIKPYIQLTHHHFSEPQAFFTKLQQVCISNREKGSVSFIDGMVLSAKSLHLTLGQFVDGAPYVSNYQYQKIYYRSISQRQTDFLSTEDYIWRWDPDWFWCSKNFGMQHWWLRLLVGKWLLKSTSYWKIMHFARSSRLLKLWAKLFGRPKETIIQDVQVPIEQAATFYAFFAKDIDIKPVWICPVQTFNSQQAFYNYALPPDKLYVNFGFWDAIPSRRTKGYYNRLLEKKLQELEGHKSLYSDVYYTEAEFWQLYDRARYDKLKGQYDPNNGLKDWYLKVAVK